MEPKEWMESEDVDEEETGYVSAPLLTVGEAARYLGVGRKIVYRLIETGELAAVKSRHAILIEKKTLDDFRKAGWMV